MMKQIKWKFGQSMAGVITYYGELMGQIVMMSQYRDKKKFGRQHRYNCTWYDTEEELLRAFPSYYEPGDDSAD